MSTPTLSPSALLRTVGQQLDAANVSEVEITRASRSLYVRSISETGVEETFVLLEADAPRVFEPSNVVDDQWAKMLRALGQVCEELGLDPEHVRVDRTRACVTGMMGGEIVNRWRTRAELLELDRERRMKRELEEARRPVETVPQPGSRIGRAFRWVSLLRAHD